MEKGKEWFYVKATTSAKTGSSDIALRSEAIQHVQEVIGLDNMASEVFVDKYLPKIKYNRIPTYSRALIENFFGTIFEELFAKELGIKYNFIDKGHVFDMINNFNRFVFGGSVMAGIVKDKFVSLGNCFVVGIIHDSYNAILQTEAQAISILKRRGGVGTDFTHLRPRGFPIANAAEESTGVVPFIRRFSNGIMEVSQAKGRRGAGMATIDIMHKDAKDVINAKTNTDQLNGVNISLRVSDDVMGKIIDLESALRVSTPAVEDVRDGWDIPIEGSALYMPQSDTSFLTSMDEAEKNFLLAIENQTKYAEPGFIFWDRVKEQLDSTIYWEQGMAPISTNPCKQYCTAA
jgi:ribonucleoside-diphosphate reductase alpha chain